MAAEISMYDVVAILTDLPQQGLVKGQVGTVVMELGPGHVEVEFVDVSGKTYGLEAIPIQHLMRLYYHRVQAA